MGRMTRDTSAAMGGPFEQMLAALPTDPEIYPHQLDLLNERVLLTRIPLADQSAASFMDQRVLKPDTQGAWFPWSRIRAAGMAAGDAAPAYILHLGHCGSTLLSRLVEAAAGARGIREPLPLRVFAAEISDSADRVAFLVDDERRARLALFERLWARGGRNVVKATSICNDVADELCTGSPVAFVYIQPEAYIAALLSGANAYADLRGFAQIRARRFRARAGWNGALAELSPGELAALCWLTEATSIATASRKIHTIDFDKFLAEPGAALSGLLAHFGLAPDAAAIEKAVTGPIMKHYAKAPEHAYDASMRSRILAEARQRHGEEIQAGMKWLESAGRNFAAGEAALQHFGGV